MALILRGLVALSAVALVVGLVLAALDDPGAYVRRFDELRGGGALHGREDWLALAADVLHGRSRSILMLGLLVLSLVPIVRVGYAFTFFLRKHDRTFTVLTATVLAILAAGLLLGRVG